MIEPLIEELFKPINWKERSDRRSAVIEEFKDAAKELLEVKQLYIPGDADYRQAFHSALDNMWRAFRNAIEMDALSEFEKEAFNEVYVTASKIGLDARDFACAQWVVDNL